MSSSSAAETDERFTDLEPATEGGYTIETIANCGVNPAASDSSFVIYNNATNLLGGWSHIAATPEYANLAMDPAVYAFENFASSADASCNEVQTHDAILVKKYADWNAQHASGLNAEFLPQDIQFGEVDEIVIELKVDSELSTIPTMEQIKALYGDYLAEDPSLLENWDHGKVNLGITLYAEGHDDQTTSTVSGMRIIEIDQDKYFDQWIRVTIQAEGLFWYAEQDYQRTAFEPGTEIEGTVLGLRINPEVKSEVVLRNYLADQWESLDPQPEELFKEMAVSIKKIELRLKP